MKDSERHDGSTSLCFILCSLLVFCRNECLGSLMVSLSWHFNGRGTLVCSLRINMARLFSLRGYFHWPNRIFPFTPYICVSGRQAVFFQWLAAERVSSLKDLLAMMAGCCIGVMKKGLIFTFLNQWNMKFSLVSYRDWRKHVKNVIFDIFRSETTVHLQ